ncbi:hypothetical protein MRB53_037976 [Persea americana]|nr:hypothetical protein MRB53_037976 [Persea americana]
MTSDSKGKVPHPSPSRTGFQSRSTPNLPTLRSLAAARKDGVEHAPESTHRLQSPSLTVSRDSSIDLTSLSPASSIHEESDEEEDEHVPLPSRPMYGHNFSRSQSYLASLAFAPPFYNRPPTPLPPSPSLTSLLRPTFSSQNSRPTTPDLSSDEGHSQRPGTGTQTPNPAAAAASTLTSSFQTAKPIPRASPKVPTYEYYGFTLYLTSSLAFLVYLLWSFLPAPFLHSLGIYYYPNRWWALAIPAWSVMFIVYIYVALAAYNTQYLTLTLTNVECLVDGAANVAVVDSTGKILREHNPSWQASAPPSLSKKSGKKMKRGAHSRQSSLTKVHQLNDDVDWRQLWNEGTDAVMDIPIGGVCEILYGASSQESEWS